MGWRCADARLCHLPDSLLTRVLRLLPVADAFALAQCSRRLLALFRLTAREELDAVGLHHRLIPIPRSTSTFHTRDPARLCAAARAAATRLRALRLPLYDSSMPDAHWQVLAVARQYCPALTSLSFVDSHDHVRKTPRITQLDLLHALLPRLSHLCIYSLRCSPKLSTLSLPGFRPSSLALLDIDPALQPQLLAVLPRHVQLTHLALSFAHIPSDTSSFSTTFLHALESCLRHALPALAHLSLFTPIDTSPLDALVADSCSINPDADYFATAVHALHSAKNSPHTKTPLVSLTLGHHHLDPLHSLSRFHFCLSNSSRINLYLPDTYLTHPPCTAANPHPYPQLLAVCITSMSSLLKLPNLYFSALSALSVCPCTTPLDRLISTARTPTPDLAFVRQLCQHAGASLRTLHLRLPITQSSHSCHVLQLLSAALAYSSRVSTLQVSADVLRFPSPLLFSLFSQLPALQHVIVTEALASGPSPLATLPSLLRALRLSCRQLQSVQFQYAAYITNQQRCDDNAISAVREFQSQMPHVRMDDFAELLELSLAGTA
ncbi:hypothetical protein BWQ96_04078 [Gracilariopsis chorda]|uniref:F-box domain-containing protein n=1 Tax=Gracilariopsis chorda TaxID=448386 RepID=A0A2V3IVQ7_9FLOR|nr:hypothetical protein BWQ96_04078 [Gracilariopsis chorda]|eukprot:PXF46201.1 hypothetical protein BWQ96_04078 [Gracilariopsis chorda]